MLYLDSPNKEKKKKAWSGCYLFVLMLGRNCETVKQLNADLEGRIHRPSKKIRKFQQRSHRIPRASTQKIRHRRRDLPSEGSIPGWSQNLPKRRSRRSIDGDVRGNQGPSRGHEGESEKHTDPGGELRNPEHDAVAVVDDHKPFQAEARH